MPGVSLTGSPHPRASASSSVKWGQCLPHRVVRVVLEGVTSVWHRVSGHERRPSALPTTLRVGFSPEGCLCTRTGAASLSDRWWEPHWAPDCRPLGGQGQWDGLGFSGAKPARYLAQAAPRVLQIARALEEGPQMWPRGGRFEMMHSAW